MVTVVLVTYESAGTVGRALDALGSLRCVVVDNASSDGTDTIVEQRHPDVMLVRSPENVGYGRGCNLGFEHVDTRYVLFMNPDVVVARDAVARLAGFLDDHSRAAMAAPAVRSPAGTLQRAGGLPSPGRVVRQALGFRGDRRRFPIEPGAAPVRTDWLCGAVLLVRSSAFREIGGFDPRFFLYFEETDLCRRIARAGHELWAVGRAEALHEGGASAREAGPLTEHGRVLARHYYPSRYYYLSKHHGRLAAADAEALELAAAGLRDVVRVLLFKPRRRELATRLHAPVFRLPP